MLLIQTTSVYIFCQRFLNRTIRQNTEVLGAEIFALNSEYEERGIDKLSIFADIEASFTERQTIGSKNLVEYRPYNNLVFDNPLRLLENKLFILNIGKIRLYRYNKSSYNIEIEKDGGVLTFTVAKNRIFIKRFDLIVFWNILSFLALGCITVLFMKNQIRSINKLKTFANEFSYLEKENSNFKPTGAREIREMGIAFINVIKKMKHLTNMRTTMLAQISHDLRTPLTRMKLQVEFIEDESVAGFFRKDLEEMEKLINEYLLFAKGENENDYKNVIIKEFFDNVCGDYRRSGYKNVKIIYDLGIKTVNLKIDSFRRCINNLINNSLKYCRKNIEIYVKSANDQLTVLVEDDGNGVSDEFLSKIKLPFYGTNKNNGFGLGLSIVQNVVNMHRGKIYFSRSNKLGGLSVKLEIPIINKRD
jgi:two-component system osmolarity sensor histidine kinase EnvZ